MHARRVRRHARRARRLAVLAARRLRFGRLRYVVIVSYGRTGSTLLQGVLMSAPHVIVRGEQGGTIALLQRWYDELCRHQDRVAPNGEMLRRSPFFGIGGFPRDEALRRLRMLVQETVLRPRLDTTMVGFKEIRWPDELGPTLEFLRKLLPGVRLVINTRDHDAVARSGFWRRRADAEVEIRRRHDAIMSAAAKLGDDVYYVCYDEWSRDPEKLRGLFEWLDIDYDRERVEAVMRKPHSYRNRSIPHLERRGATPRDAQPEAQPALAPRRSFVRYLAAGWGAVAVAQVAAVIGAIAGVGPYAN